MACEIEAFIYIWFDSGRGMRYIGVHKGNPDDGYICSSKPMLFEHTKRPKDFRRQIIDRGIWKDMLVREQALIAEYDAVKDPMFYNQSNGFGPYHADHTDTKHTPETKAKMSMSHRDRRHTAETKLKMSESAKGNKYTLGHKQSKEHKSKRSAALVGKPLSEETKAKLSSVRMGKHPTEETKKKLVDAMLKRWHQKRSKEGV
jgi:hypothetical protein